MYSLHLPFLLIIRKLPIMKLTKLSLGIIALSFVAFTSCKNEAEEQATPTQSEVQTNENPKTTASLNPAHGQPGHRCDIPVGADLNQASGNVQMQQSTNTANPNVSPVRVNSSTETPAKNPPHGQPGHDCTKPVGADL